jgi:hypothetical protein
VTSKPISDLKDNAFNPDLFYNKPAFLPNEAEYGLENDCEMKNSDVFS